MYNVKHARRKIVKTPAISGRILHLRVPENLYVRSKMFSCHVRMLPSVIVIAEVTLIANGKIKRSLTMSIKELF
jgi:hypothetical protein